MNALVHADHYKSASLFVNPSLQYKFYFLHFIFVHAFALYFASLTMIC